MAKAPVRRNMRELHLKATVQPGGRIEVVNKVLPVGESVDVIVRYFPRPARRLAVDILDEAPGHRLFKSAAKWMRTWLKRKHHGTTGLTIIRASSRWISPSRV